MNTKLKNGGKMAIIGKKHSFPHIASGETCCTSHFDEEGECEKCQYCREWIRPSHMKDLCRKHLGAYAKEIRTKGWGKDD